jgi:hypothetical protein
MDDADICHAVCTMIAQNICQIVHMTARLHGLNKVFFTGNFLRHNDVAQKYGCAKLSSVLAKLSVFSVTWTGNISVSYFFEAKTQFETKRKTRLFESTVICPRFPLRPSLYRTPLVACFGLRSDALVDIYCAFSVATGPCPKANQLRA